LSMLKAAGSQVVSSTSLPDTAQARSREASFSLEIVNG
jgi:hypothetical protein